MQQIPIFPLNLVVLPGEPVPLHIFEPRYRQLIADCAPLPGQRQYQPFGISYAKDNKLNEIGCTVVVDEILHKYPEGELDIMTYGQRRYRLIKTFQERAYLMGEVEWQDDLPSAEPQVRETVLDLYHRFLELVEAEEDSLDPASLQLSYEIAFRIHLEKIPKLELLEAESEAVRLNLLQRYLEDALPQIEEAREFRRRVRANGYFIHPD